MQDAIADCAYDFIARRLRLVHQANPLRSGDAKPPVLDAVRIAGLPADTPDRYGPAYVC